MAILLPGDYFEPMPPGPAPTGCVYCGDGLPEGQPAVYWFGDWLLLFHPSCAVALGVHLIADAREATLAAGASGHWNRRAARVVRAALQAAEQRP